MLWGAGKEGSAADTLSTHPKKMRTSPQGSSNMRPHLPAQRPGRVWCVSVMAHTRQAITTISIVRERERDMSVQQVPPACTQTSYTLAPGLPCGVHWHMYTHQYECIRTHMYAYFACYGVRGKEGCAAADAPEDAYFPCT